MTHQRPGQKVFKNPGPDWGVRVIEPGPQAAGGGWWDDYGSIGCCIGAWQAKGAADYASSLLDLSSNGNNLTEGNGAVPWLIVNGWMFIAAAAQWLDTGITPVNDQTWSMLVQFTNVAADAARALLGVTQVAANFLIRPWRNNRVHYSTGGLVTVPPQLVAGNLGFAAAQGYRDGIPDGAPCAPAAGVLNDVYIGARNNTGVADQFVEAYIRAVAIYDCTLTPAEMAAVWAWMAAL